MAQYAVGFIERLLGPGKMQQSEVQNNGIKGRIRKCKLLCVAFQEFDSRIPASRFLNHFGGKIHAGGNGSASSRRSRRIAWTAGDVKHTRGLGHSCGVEQRRHRLRCYARKAAV